MSQCFVIQPFDDSTFDKRFDDIFAPAIKKAGLVPYRVDRDPTVSIPIANIESEIINSKVCFAEITTDNPNVWFELGFAIAASKEVILVCSTERHSEFPFDVRHRTIIEYKIKSPKDFANLKDKITQRIKAILNKQSETDKKKSFPENIADGTYKIHIENELRSQIWEGIYKDFKSFNDPWKMEMDNPNDFIDVHQKRYRNKKCGTYNFLFFLRNNGYLSFERFIKFQSLVHLELSKSQVNSKNFKAILETKISEKENLPESLKHISVFINKELSPNQTFFTGHKNGNQRISLWYVSIDVASESPYIILETSDYRFWRDLNNTWNNARKNLEEIEGVNIFKSYLDFNLKGFIR